MQVIYSKTLKIFALLNLFFLFLAPSVSLRVNLKRNKKIASCKPHPSPFQRRGGQEGVFCSLIFARLRCAKINAKRKKWKLKSKTLGRILDFIRAWPRTNAVPIRVNAFLGPPGRMADLKEKSREREPSFVLDFFGYYLCTAWLKCALHICPNQVKKVEY